MRKPFSWSQFSILILVFGITGNWVFDSHGQVPLYVNDFGVEIKDWAAGDLELPELVRQMDFHGVVHLENAENKGDVGLFEDPPGTLPHSMQYLGFGGLWFGEPNNVIDPDRKSKTTEAAYFHSTDPATFQAWRTTNSVELRWTPDYRHVQRDEYILLNTAALTDTVEHYVIHRTTLDGTNTVVLDTVSSSVLEYSDTGVVGGVQYEYSLFSIEAEGGEMVAFSSIPDTVLSEETGPRFWVEKLDYQERVYDEHLVGNIGNVVSVTWPFKFYVDEDIGTSSNVVIEIAENNIGSTYTFSELTGLSYSFSAGRGELTYSWPTDTTQMTTYGGIVYRLRYAVGGDTLYYPEIDSSGKNHFIWSSINNRTMGVEFLNYMMDTTSDAWKTVMQYQASRLATGLNLAGSGGVTVDYDRILLDTVLGVMTDAHNVIRPYNFSNNASHIQGTIQTVKALCDSVDIGFVANTPNQTFLEGMTGQVGFIGAMDENLPFQGEGWSEVGDFLWLVHGRPSWKNILAAQMDFGENIGDRRQLFTAYLFGRSQQIGSGEPNLSYGYLKWDNVPADEEGKVNIFPEQRLRLGDSLVDHFSSTTWPDQGTWRTTIVDTIIHFTPWISANTNDLVRSDGDNNFMIRKFDLEDGISDSTTTLLALWHLIDPDDLPTANFTFGNLIEMSEDELYYPVVFDNRPLDSGGWIKTDSQGYGESDLLSTFPLNILPFASRRIQSPTIGNDFEDPHSVEFEYPLRASTTAVPPVLTVRVSHWNGEKLAEVRIVPARATDSGGTQTGDFTAAGWPDEILLFDNGQPGDSAALDSLYTWEGTAAQSVNGITPGAYKFPVIVTGTDSLMRFGTVTAQVTNVVPWVSGRAVYSLAKDATDGALFGIETDSPLCGVSAIFQAYVDASSIGGSTQVDLNDSKLVGDQYASDGIWSGRIVGPINVSPGLYDLPVVVQDSCQNQISTTVQVEVIEGFAVQFLNKSGSTGQLKDLDENPYSTATINFGVALSDTSDFNKEDIIVSRLDGTIQVFKYWNFQNGVPEFIELSHSSAYVEGTSLQDGNRGLSVADLNNDGYEDFVVARHFGPQLFQCDTTDTSNRYKDITDQIGLMTDTTFTSGAPGFGAAASWADYNQDGWVDLIMGVDAFNWPVVPTEPDSSEHQTQGFGGEHVILFRNDGGRLIWDPLGEMYSVVANSFSINWGDIDGDGDQDLFVPDYFDGSNSKVFINDGFSGGYSFTEESLTWLSGFSSAIVGAEFVDVDSDGNLDLITCSDTGTDNLHLFLNNGSPTSPELVQQSSSTTRLPVVADPLNSLFSGDFDLNGYMDIVTLPARENRPPRMLFNNLELGAGVFSRSVAFDSIQTGLLYGGVANDWNTDGDLEIFFARSPEDALSDAEDFFYQAVDAGGNDAISGASFIKVRLVGNGLESNMSAIGAKVEVFDGGQRIGPAQWVSGGDSRGGQKPRTLAFGFPAGSQPTGPVDIHVEWPDGTSEVFGNKAVQNGRAYLLRDTREGMIIPGSITATKVLDPDNDEIDWTFTWRSNRILEDVGVNFDPDPPGRNNSTDCFCNTNGSVIVVNSSNATVFPVNQVGPWEYEYKVVWEGWCCSLNCGYEIEVFGDFEGNEISGGPVLSATKICSKKFPGM